MKPHVVVVAILLCAPAVVLAQPAPAPSPVVVTGEVAAGTRQVDNDTNSSKLTEYRDLRSRAFVPRVTLNLLDTRNGRFAEFGGANIGLRDQALFARGGVAGSWRADVDWVDIPHDFSNKAQTPFNQRQPGVFDVPANAPITFKRLATAAADTPGVLASDTLIAAYQRAFLHGTPLATDHRTGRFGFEYGAEAMKVGASYNRRLNSGLKWTFGPIGDRPPRTLNIQLAEPTDDRTQELMVSAERIAERYALQFNYLFSDFANQVDTLVWENIYTTAAPDATYDVWDRAVSTFGVRPLAPDSRYHNAAVSLGGDLPFDSRLNGTVAYGRVEQNEALLPYSFHVDLLANPTLPRATADASVDTMQVLLDYAMSPTSRVNVRAFLRYYGLDNDTPEANWQYVTSDTSNLNGTVSYKNKRINLAYATDRTNTGAELTYRMRPWRSSIGAVYELEAAAREHREADTTENRVSLVYRARPAARVNLRARYLFGVRDGDYDPFVTRESYWYSPAEVSGDADDPRRTFDNHPDMRRYDVSDRRRTQGEFVLTVTPDERWSISGSVRHRADDFDSDVSPIQPLAGTGFSGQAAFTPGLQLGLLEDSRLRAAIDAFYMPVERLSLNVFLSMDDGSSVQRGLEFNENNKQNPEVIATAELGPWTRASSQWMADTTDRIWTFGAGSTIGIVPNRVILNGSYTLSLGDIDIDYSGFGVTNWDGTPFPPNHQFAFPASPPRVNQDWHVADVRLEFPFLQRSLFTVGYTYERFRTDDWQQATDLPWVESVGSEFLLRDTSRSFQWGNRLLNFGSFLAPSYDAHFGYAAFTHRF
ncbi:MAG: MtrB/PioB family outer membrane beta-barrel protein [Acidobacteria bacterium]|nr:MtrB/PioB family outer membrane beta-barrel protein [Acidobacteriota bacterium]